MNAPDPAKMLNLIEAYAALVGELDVTYYLQDQDKINQYDADVNRIEKELGIVWRDGHPVFAGDDAPERAT